MQTLRRRVSHEDSAAVGASGRPVLLVTLDVPYAEEAIAFAVDAAVENGQPLLLVNVAEVLPTAYSLARSFTQDRSPVALGLAKQMLYRNSAAGDPLEAHLSDSLAMFWTSIGDGKEGVAAFLEKRTPRFTGKASQIPRVFP